MRQVDLIERVAGGVHCTASAHGGKILSMLTPQKQRRLARQLGWAGVQGTQPSPIYTYQSITKHSPPCELIETRLKP
jgi:hypothetical protein